MSHMDASALLAVWETGARQPPLTRALGLLDAAWPADPPEAWASVSMGARDAALLTLREQLFGPALETVANCPACGERLELNFSTTQLRGSAAPEQPAALAMQIGDYHLQCRLPTSADLLAVASAPAAAQAAQLMQRCIASAEKSGTAVAPHTLPAAVEAEIAERLAQADPLAEASIALDCPACGQVFASRFDILSHLWGDIEDWAQRLLADIHLLASRYGWSERDILAMSATRRGWYVDLLIGGRVA